LADAHGDCHGSGAEALPGGWRSGEFSGFGPEEVAAGGGIVRVFDDVEEDGLRGEALAVDDRGAGAVMGLDEVDVEAEVGGGIVNAEDAVADLVGDLVNAASGEGFDAAVADAGDVVGCRRCR